MANAPFVIDVTADRFEQEVILASERVPVLVDFWAAWCGPCKTLMPTLTRLAEAYQGQFLLAKVNIDEEQALATRFGVRSVPTVKVFRYGKVVDEFLGAQPEGQIRALLDRYVETEVDRALNQVAALFEQGRRGDAIEATRAIVEQNPDHLRSRIVLAEMLAGEGGFDEAEHLLAALPMDVRMEPGVQALLSQIEFARVNAGAPPIDELERRIAAAPDDSEARYLLGAAHLAAGDFEAALETFLELMRRDRSYGDDAGRKGILKVFEQLGDGSALVSRYRRRMASLLY